jgi:hypothetical protein
MWLGNCAKSIDGKRGQRLLRSAEPGVHELVAVEHDRKLCAAANEPQPATTGDLGSPYFYSWDHQRVNRKPRYFWSTDFAIAVPIRACDS